MTSRFIAGVIRVRWLVIVVWLGLMAVSGSIYLAKFRIDNSVAIWFLEDDPELANYRKSLDAFGEKEWTWLWLRTDSVLAPKLLSELKELDHVHRVIAIPGQTEELSIVAIENDNLIQEVEPYRIRLIDRIREIVASYPTIIDSGLVGTTVINAELNRAAKRDMFVFYTLIAGFVMLVGGFVLRYRRDLLVLIAVVAGAVVPVLGAVAALGFSFNLITVMLPTLLVTVSVSYLIHFLNEFHLERSAGPALALANTFRRLLKPGFWTSVTTVIGFLSLTFSGVAPIRQVGWFAALGIVLAWVTTLTLAPALLSLLWPKPEEETRRSNRRRRSAFVMLHLIRKHPLLAVIIAAAIIAGALGLPRLHADTNYVEFFKSGNSVRVDYQQLLDAGLPQSSLDITISFPEGAERLRQVEVFEEALRSLPEVKRVDSPSSLMGGAGALEFIARDGNAIRLRIMTDYMGTTQLGEFREQLSEVIAKSLPPDLVATPTGTNLLWANMDEQVIRTQLLSIGITSAFVIVILPFIFRSVTLGLLGFLVSFAPIACTLGVMAWMELPVNIATCLLGGVVIGLSVDDTIYFVSRIRNALDDGWSMDAAIRRAIWSTGRAMMKTSAVLIGGFLTMAASDFMPSVYFGLFFAASIVIALLADLLLLPALLRCIYTKSSP